jgi:hypothetical protein
MCGALLDPPGAQPGPPGGPPAPLLTLPGPPFGPSRAPLSPVKNNWVLPLSSALPVGACTKFELPQSTEYVIFDSTYELRLTRHSFVTELPS